MIDGACEVARLEIEQASIAAVLEEHTTHPALRIPQAPATLPQPHIETLIRLVSESLSIASQQTLLRASDKPFEWCRLAIPDAHVNESAE
ncbi:hypothetical protein [Streptomyces sp. NPDC059788]|uniref:hypothetical protein n=1 Tax=Streptomyces sp. NPDC059788 TaxID=3346948 RepID=UPI003647D11E